MAQAPGQKGAIIPSSSEPQRVDTKALTTDASLPVWGTRQGMGLSHRGDLGQAHPSWFGHGLLTRPSSATAGLPVPGRRCVPGDLRSAERRCREILAERYEFATKAVGIRGRSRPTAVGRTAVSGDPRRTIRIRNESSRDQRAFKTNFAACQGGPQRGGLNWPETSARMGLSNEVGV